MATPTLQETFWNEMPKIMSELVKISVSAAKKGFDVSVTLYAGQKFIFVGIEAPDTAPKSLFIHFFDVEYVNAELKKVKAMIKRYMDENAKSIKTSKEA